VPVILTETRDYNICC